MTKTDNHFIHDPTEKQADALEILYDDETDFLLFGGAAGGGWGGHGEPVAGCIGILRVCHEQWQHRPDHQNRH